MTPGQAASITDVHIVYSNHLDVGFDGISPIPGFARNVVNRYLQVYFPRALETAANVSAITGGEQRYVWMTQCWLVSLYLSCPSGMGYNCPSAEEVLLVREAIAKGTITWHAFPFNSELELLEPSLLTAGLELCASLSAEFGLPAPRTLSQRDVPGMTRAVIPLLEAAGVSAVSVGVNGFAAPPAFPPVCVWSDPASNTSVILSNHPGGYGGILAADATFVEGLTHVLIPDWQTDNHGPHSSEDVMTDLAIIQSQFPNAKIYASTFDAFLVQLETVRDVLPVVTAESGDTWIWGVASDPWKLSQFRLLQSLRAQCIATPYCDSTSSSFLNFTRLLLKGSEHTWGGDVKLFLQAQTPSGALNQGSAYTNWSNADFHAIQATRDPSVQAMEATWVEQRAWAIDDALQALPSDHPIQAAFAEDIPLMRAVLPTPSASQGWQLHDLTSGPVRFELYSLNISLCPVYGHVVSLQCIGSPDVADWASADKPLASLVYQTLDQSNYTQFQGEYGMCLIPSGDCPWAAFDFGKEGLDAGAQPRSQTVRPTVTEIWSREVERANTVLVHLSFPADLVSSYGAPADVWLQYDTVVPAWSLGVTVSMFDKTATRIPEAMWMVFDTAFTPPPNNTRADADGAEGDKPQKSQQPPASHSALDQGWMVRKLNSLVDPRDVLLNGSQTLHAQWGGVLLGADSPQTQLSITSPDAALVSAVPLEQLSPFPALDPQVHAQGGEVMAFNLVNNVWGTNYIMSVGRTCMQVDMGWRSIGKIAWGGWLVRGSARSSMWLSFAAVSRSFFSIVRVFLRVGVVVGGILTGPTRLIATCSSDSP